MRRQVFNVIIATLMMFMISSCATKQSAVNRLEKFSYELRDNGEYYSVGDWKKAADEFIKIRRDIQKHDYTQEERQRIGELEGQCAGYVAKGIKGKVKSIGSEINGILQGILGAGADE